MNILNLRSDQTLSRDHQTLHHKYLKPGLCYDKPSTLHGSRCLENGTNIKVKVKAKFSLQQATKAQGGSRGIALLFLQPRR